MIKKIILAALFIISIQCFGFSQNKHSALAGNWESVEVNSSGRGLHLTIKKDSSFELDDILRADYDYLLKGNLLITRLITTAGKTIIDTSTFEIKGDSLTSNFKRDTTVQIIRMVRLNHTKKRNSIVGNWKWRYPNDVMAFSKFTSNGKWLFRLPTNSRKGKYKTSDSVLEFDYDAKGDKPDKYTYWVKKNILILTNKDGKEEMYKRVDY